MASEPDTTAIERLTQWRDVGDGPIGYCAGDRQFAEDVKAALVTIDRLRKAFTEDCEMCGYTEDETRTMLAEVENGKA